jgi:hypothetical protein
MTKNIDQIGQQIRSLGLFDCLVSVKVSFMIRAPGVWGDCYLTNPSIPHSPPLIPPKGGEENQRHSAVPAVPYLLMDYHVFLNSDRYGIQNLRLVVLLEIFCLLLGIF